MPGEHARGLLTARGLRPKKRFGQNFLMDGAAARRIAQLTIEVHADAPSSRAETLGTETCHPETLGSETCHPERSAAGAESKGEAPAQRRVLEIGAGTGTLTHALLEAGAQLTVLEIDRDLIDVLRAREDLHGVKILHADAMTFDYAAFAGGRPWRVAGNLPYNVATPLLVNLVEMHDGPETIVAMIQKDVADRLVAKPATPAYGSLSVAVQYAMDVERAFTLKPRAFFPPPKVDSTVVRLTRRATKAVSPRDERLFLQVVRAAFAYRRKTLANSLVLALGFDRDAIAAAIAASDLQREIRGEQLDLRAFARLADALAEGRL